MSSLPPALVRQLERLAPEQQAQFLGDIEALDNARDREKSQDGFLAFVEAVWPEFISGYHHRKMADAFDRVAEGTLKRLIINIAPRHTKSEFGSFHLPAWYLGLFPDRKVIQCSHTSDLAVGFGRKVRNLIDEDVDYQDIFPGTWLRHDAKAAGKWNTNKKGEYFAIGVGGAVTGKGADLLIIDDPHSEQEGQSIDPEVFDKCYEWYTSGPRQRLQPGGAIVVIMTRWHKRDLTGRLLKTAAQKRGADQWELIEFPALLPSRNPLWPEFWPKAELLALEAELPVAKWQAQYQQNPTSEEGAILKRELWRRWEEDKVPKCKFMIMSLDTAYTKETRSDYNAYTIWGIFDYDDKKGQPRSNIMLLNAFRKRMEFPELKKRTKDTYDEWKPDSFIIENKSSGISLIQELRSGGMPVTAFNVGRGSKWQSNDKIARANSVTDIFESGLVWAPETKWADEVITECAEFPTGDHDDYVDTVVMALLRYRQGGFLRLDSDEDEEEYTAVNANYY